MGGIAPSPDGSTSAGIKRTWSYIKLLHSESMGIPALFWNNRVRANHESKAEALRDQYESVFMCEDLINIPVLPESPCRDIQDITFCARESKACGPDQIPTRVLKESTSELAPIFASLFQQSFNDGALPSAWKDANITAIFKKGHSADPKNYRPVSLTSLIAKTMEHIICKQICSHLSENSAISQHQQWL